MKLLVFDLDGTLLEEDGTLDPRTIELLHRLAEANIETTIATGRSLKSAAHFVEALSLRVPVILFNGARIYDPVNKNYLESKFLAFNAVEKIVSLSRGRKVSLFFFVDEEVYAMCVSPHATRYIFRDGLSYHLIENLTQLQTDRITKLVISGPSHELTELELTIRPEVKFDASVTRSEEDLLEILPAGVSKADALKRLCMLLGISLKDVVAFGNGENDSEMIEISGLGVSFAFAPESVKKRAKVILERSGYLGLKEFTEKFIERVRIS